jgi:hypothetical protein
MRREGMRNLLIKNAEEAPLYSKGIEAGWSQTSNLSEPSSISRLTGRSICPIFLPNSTNAGRICYPQKTGKEPPAPCSVSASPASHSNFITRPSRKRLLGPFVHATLHWPEADAVLAGHPAHRSVAESAENRGVLSLACDLTKAIAALVPVTDSLAVCWLNGPALNSSKSFVETAREMFGTGLHPLALWVAVRWDGQAGALHTQGMAQFGAPEICLSKPPNADPLMVDTLFHVAQSVLTSPHSIPDGKTTDSPQGKLKIEQSGVPGRRTLILEPARSG